MSGTSVAGRGGILLIGANGQLGTDLARVFAGPALVAVTRRDVDVTDTDTVDRLMARAAPRLVLNAAAFNRVDDAETDPGPAFALNATAVHHLARIAARSEARLVHFSTDYVFGAAEPGPYAEDAVPAPVNAYGVSKLAGERLALRASPRHLVIRSSGLYGVAGSRGKVGNFVETILRLAREGRPIRVVADQVLAPTYTADLAETVARLLDANPSGGIYHLTNGGACSWFEFARHILALCGFASDLTPTTSEAYGAPARRPADSTLLDTRTPALGIPPLRPWPEALRAYLVAKGHVPP